MNRTTRTRGWVTMQNLSERVRERSLLGNLPRISASVAAHILLGGTGWHAYVAAVYALGYSENKTDCVIKTK